MLRCPGPRGSRARSALAQLRGILEEELESIRGAGTWKSERVITSCREPHIHVEAPGVTTPSWESPDLAGCWGVLRFRWWRSLEAVAGGAQAHMAAAGPLPLCQARLTFPTVNSNLIRSVHSRKEGNFALSAPFLFRGQDSIRDPACERKEEERQPVGSPYGFKKGDGGGSSRNPA